MYQDITNIK